TRLGHLTAAAPKSMVSINGEPFASRQLKLLARQGFREVIFCVGMFAEQIQEFVGDGRQFGLQVKYSLDGDELLGTGGAIAKALPL
ncbi:sugar phosphate nucleotidyltransferase, partial [Acinetobacter baumannii]